MPVLCFPQDGCQAACDILQALHAAPAKTSSTMSSVSDSSVVPLYLTIRYKNFRKRGGVVVRWQPPHFTSEAGQQALVYCVTITEHSSLTTSMVGIYFPIITNPLYLMVLACTTSRLGVAKWHLTLRDTMKSCGTPTSGFCGFQQTLWRDIRFDYTAVCINCIPFQQY